MMNNQYLNQQQRPGLFTRVMIIFAMFVVIQLPPEILAIIKYVKGNALLTGLSVVAYLALFGVIIYGTWRLYRRYRVISVRPGIFIADIGIVITGYLAIFGGQIVLGILNQLFFNQSQTANNQVIEGLMKDNSVILIVLSFSAIFLTPFAEELIFRGLITNLFFKDDSFWPKVILSGFIFSLGHVSTNIISFLVYFYMGAVLAFIYVKTGRIRIAIMLHMVNNAVAIVEMIALLQK
ncbi:CPBP family intramembrane glutamic endopeptidase [Paucilactobacillus nenjiangensis]|uniref:CPBP family intramembrane glutamic endopeptidase n=1 Tax=Paucilactobacillus nenjiangensis TaxID=1296540 RepID=UPI0028D60001|nr:type II CAAX endopeptidase family protein [Paucilactobacillus nenjiangensis]